MALVLGSTYDIFVTSAKAIFIGVTTDPNNPPPPVLGEFNLEVILYGNHSLFFTMAPGYQGLAVMETPGGATFSALQGDFGIVDAGVNDRIRAGAGNVSILGAPGDTLQGGAGGRQFLDAHLGNQLVVGGNSGNETIWGGPGDVVLGDAGANVTIAGISDTIIGFFDLRARIGTEFIDGSRGNESIVGGRGDATIWGGPGDTIQGGSGGNVTIGGAPGDTIIAGVPFDSIIGGPSANEFIDGSAGNQSITGGVRGNETIWGGPGDTIQGGSAGNETIAGVSGETIVGGMATTFFDATSGNESIIAGGGGNSTIWGGAHDTIQGASASGSALIGFAGGNETFWDDGATSGRHDSISTFNQPGGDRVSLNSATDTPGGVAGTAVTDGSGNTTVTFSDGSTLTFIGISGVNNTFFTTH
jgi:hypothetical protein